MINLKNNTNKTNNSFYNKEELLKKFKKEKNELNLNNYYVENNEKYSPKICLIIITCYIVLLIMFFISDSWIPELVTILVTIAIWTYSLLSVIKNDFKKENNKLVWIALLIFLPFMAIFYPDFRKIQIVKEN